MRKLSLVAAATVLTVALAGCGSDDPAGGDGGGDATFDPTSIAKDDTLAALVPEDVASTGKLVFGSDTTYAPAEFIDEDGTTPVGYDVDIAKAIGAVLGLEAVVEPASFTGIIPAIGSKYDAGISSFTITAERIEQANMIAYFEAGEAFAVQSGNPQDVDADDLCGLTVGVQTGTVEDDA
ncbi:MAG: transporter substrate-binding domain-containing protein, partial [Cellulomonadaceae bacterium]